MRPEILTPGAKLTIVAETPDDLNDIVEAAESVMNDGSAKFYRELDVPIGIGRSVGLAAIEGFMNGATPRAADHLAALGLGSDTTQSLQTEV